MLLLPTTYNQSFMFRVKSVDEIKNQFTKLLLMPYQGENYSSYALAQLNLTQNKIQLRILYC